MPSGLLQARHASSHLQRPCCDPHQQPRLHSRPRAASSPLAARATAGHESRLSATAASSTSNPAPLLARTLCGLVQNRLRPALATAQQAARQQLLSTDTKAFAMAALVAPTLPGDGLSDLLLNRTFWAGFWGWFMAQFAKIFTEWYKKGVFDVTNFFKAGGMPSSHSALCAAVATDLALTHGLASPLFSIAVCFSVIVMYDAAGVRRHAGKQAEVLNKVINELLEGHEMAKIKLKEVLGHTPLQVAMGAILGISVGILLPQPIPVIVAA